MLEHYFWLLEFKFKFEFYCLNPFLKYLNPISNPYPFPPLQSTGLRKPNPAASRAARTSLTAARQHSRPPLAPAAQPARPNPATAHACPRQQPCRPPHPPSAPARLAFRPKQAHGHRRSALPAAEADDRGPPVIPFLATGSTRTPPPAPSPPRVRILRVAHTPKAVP
jgi:hypothetical protein